jgi:hypothetical protein
LNRERFLIVLGADAERWAKRYDIEPFSHPCSECGRMLTTSIPFAEGTLRGLVAPRCACGNDLTPYGAVRDPKFGDLFSGIEAPSSRPPAILIVDDDWGPAADPTASYVMPELPQSNADTPTTVIDAAKWKREHAKQ